MTSGIHQKKKKKEREKKEEEGSVNMRRMQISFLVTPSQDPCLPKKKLPEIITFDPSKANVKKPNWMGLKKKDNYEINFL